MSTGVITYCKQGRRIRVPYASVTSLEAIETFAAATQQYITAGTHSVGFTVFSYPNTPETPDEFPDPQYEAQIMLKLSPEAQEQNPSDHPWREVTFPAPKNSGLFVYDPTSKTYKVTPAAGEDIAQKFSAMTGKTYEFQHGSLCE